MAIWRLKFRFWYKPLLGGKPSVLENIGEVIILIKVILRIGMALGKDRRKFPVNCFNHKQSRDI